MEETSTELSQSEAPETTAKEAKPAAKQLSAGEARAKLLADMGKELKDRRAKRSAPDESDDSDDDDAPAKPKAAAKTDDKTKPAESAVEKRIEAKETKLERAGVDVPDQKKNESDSAYDLRLAKLLREKEELQREHAKSTKELAKLQKAVEDGKANPLTLLEHIGVSFDQLVRGINDKKYGKPDAKPSIPQEILDQIAELKKDKEDRESAAQAKELKAAAEARQSKDLKTASDFLKDNSDDFPFLASVPWGASEAVRQAYADKATDLLPIFQKLEENLANNAEKLVMSDKAMKKAIKANPELKKALKALFDDEPAKPAKKKDDDEDDEVTIKGVSDLVAEPQARSTKKSREDQIRDVGAALKERRRKAKSED